MESSSTPPHKSDFVIHKRGTFVSLTLAALLGALSLLAPASASADVLVSNISKPDSSASRQAISDAFAQAFTTAPAPGSVFVLESIEVGIFKWRTLTNEELPHIRAQLWSSRNNGEPGSKIADLTPAQSVRNRNTYDSFAAPAGTRLEGNTTYYFVNYTTRTLVDSDNDPTYNVRSTTSDSEDTDTLSGWSIADGFRITSNGNADPTAASGWGTLSGSLKIRVNGSLDPATRGSVTLSANPNPVAAGGLVTFTMLASHGAFPKNLFLNMEEGVGSAWWDTAPTFPDSASTQLELSPRPSETQMTAGLRINSNAGGETIVINLRRSDGGLQEGPLTIRVLGSGSGGPPSTEGGGGGGSSGGGGISAPTPTPTTQPPPTEQPPSSRCGENDRENLVRLYDATGGDNWNDHTDWKSEEPLQEWFGVDTDEDGEVVSLRLADNSLSGEISEELLSCFSELKELALWGNEDLSVVEIPEDLLLAVERAALREIAETLNLNPKWFEDYEDPFNFEDWYEGVTTDDEERVVELNLPGEIPESIVSQFKKLREIMITTNSGGGCALSPEGSSAFGLFLLTLVVFAVLVRKKAR